MLSAHDLDCACVTLFGAQPPSLNELRRGAWEDTLRKAFRRRAFETHPDRARSLGRCEAVLAAEFRELEGAYELVAAYLAAPPPLPPPARRPPPARGPTPTPTPTPRRAPVSGSAPSTGPRTPTPPPPRAAAASTSAASSSATTSPELFYKGPMPTRPLRLVEFIYFSGLISWQRMIAAITWQRQQRPRVGELAVRYGLMTRDEVDELLGQRMRGDATLPFVEHAVRLGLLAPAQRPLLLSGQRALQPRIGEYFLRNGLLDREQLSHLLHCVRQMNRERARKAAGVAPPTAAAR